MKVVLTKNVPSLGQIGEVKEVKKGFGLNYLLPQGLAELATRGAIKVQALRATKVTQEREKKLATLEASIKGIDGKTVKVLAKSENGKLFGSIAVEDIVAAFAQAGVETMAEMFVLERPIKTTGEHTVPVRAGQASGAVVVSVSTE